MPADSIVSGIIAGKSLLPTALSSAEIRRRIPPGLRQRAIFSARTIELSVIKTIKEAVEEVASGKLSGADARLAILGALDETGYNPEALGDTGLRDRSSRRRLDLIIKTNRQMAAGAAQASEDATARALYPAWRLERYRSRMRPRADWYERWRAAGDAVGWEGALRQEMVARKDSPIWAAIGRGEGGFRDTLGNPYPPFAFGSGMGWTPVSADEAERMGLSASPAAETPVTLAPSEQEIADAASEFGITMEDLL